MSDVTDTYREECRKLSEAYEKVVDVCHHVVMLADLLRTRPRELQIGGISNALGIAASTLTFDASRWPTATDINNALAEYHHAVSAARTAWTNVQIRNEQAGLAPPESDPWAAMRNEFLRRVNLPPH